jgi:hypothetical protein
MARSRTNLYSPNLSGMDPQVSRTIRDLVDRINYLTSELDTVRGDMPTGGAKKENPQPGIVSIPCRDAGGQDGFIRVNQDGVVQSYVNPVESIFPYTDLSSVGNVGAGTDTLHTFTLPANTLSADGDWIRFVYAGSFATNDNDKRIQILFDGQVFEDFGAFDFDAGIWVVGGDYSRVSPTSVRATSIGMYGEPLVMDEGVVSGTPDIIYLARNQLLTVSNLSTTAVAMTVTGTATANDDIVQNKSLLQYFRPRTVKLV